MLIEKLSHTWAGLGAPCKTARPLSESSPPARQSIGRLRKFHDDLAILGCFDVYRWHTGCEVSVLDSTVFPAIGFHEMTGVAPGENVGKVEELLQGNAFAVNDKSALMVPSLDLIFRIFSIKSLILKYDPGIIGALRSPFPLFLEKAGYVGEMLASGLFIGFII